MKSQTLNLLKKEIKLGNNFQTVIWLICCLGMYFIPNYPSYIGSFYITICIMLTFAMNQSSHDLLYTILLPVRKIDTVKARFLYCALIEILAVLFGVIAALVKYFAAFPSNKAGINLTPAFFGFMLCVFALFNFIFLGNVYKNPLKPGLRYLCAGVAYFLGMAFFEFPVWVYSACRGKLESGEIAELPKLAPLGKTLTEPGAKDLPIHLAILGSGIVIYALVWLLTFKRAAKQFEKYDM